MREFGIYNRVITLPAGECCSGGTKVNRLIDGKVCGWFNIIVFQDIFKDHLRHAACASAKYSAAFEHGPVKIIHGFAAHEKITGALCKLGKIDGIIFCASNVSIDGSFGQG